MAWQRADRRLARDNSGLLLQIVPTINDVTMVNVGNPFTGQTLRLTGNGFAEGSSAVLMGVQRIDDVSRNYGIDVYNSSSTLDLTVPNGAPTGPIRVVTAGGTSAAFGIAFSGITASATSGTPQDVGTASA